MKLLLASNNAHKIKEFLSLFPKSYELISPKEIGIHFEVEETGITFEENAIIKSEHLFQLSKMPSIADDSGIVVEALNGEPGVYSARFGETHFSDKDRALFLLEKMKGKSNRNAYYRAVISYTDSKGTQLFSANCHGQIMEDYDLSGSGFGYDPIFFQEELGKRFSQVSLEEKNKVSHRSLAIQSFLKSQTS